MTAVYVGGIPGRPINALRKVLLKRLPSLAVPSISFIGSNITQILNNHHLVQRLIATIWIMGFKQLCNYDPFRLLRSDDLVDIRRCPLACAKHCKILAASTKSPASINWYYVIVNHIISDDPSIANQNPPTQSAPGK